MYLRGLIDVCATIDDIQLIVLLIRAEITALAPLKRNADRIKHFFCVTAWAVEIYRDCTSSEGKRPSQRVSWV